MSLESKKKSDLVDFQRIIQRYSYCKPLLHRDSSIIEFSSQNPAKPDQIVKKPHQKNNKDFYHLSNVKYQNYKYVKYNFNKTFSSPITKNSHCHLKYPKEKTIENIYKIRNSNIKINENYQNDKNHRILDSRYQNYRMPKIPFNQQENQKNFKRMQELQNNIQKLSETQLQNCNNKWVSPYIFRLKAKEKVNKIPKKLNFLEMCKRIFQEILRIDIEKNIRLNIFSSQTQRKKRFEQISRKTYSFKDEISQDTNNISKGFHEEKISIDSFKIYFNNYFSEKQWERLFFSLKLPYEEDQICFEVFLLFCRIFLNRSASLEEKFDFIKRSFQYPDEELQSFNANLIENVLRTNIPDNKIWNKPKINALIEKISDILSFKYKHLDHFDEIIEIIFVRK